MFRPIGYVTLAAMAAVAGAQAAPPVPAGKSISQPGVKRGEAATVQKCAPYPDCLLKDGVQDPAGKNISEKGVKRSDPPAAQAQPMPAPSGTVPGSGKSISEKGLKRSAEPNERAAGKKPRGKVTKPGDNGV